MTQPLTAEQINNFERDIAEFPPAVWRYTFVQWLATIRGLEAENAAFREEIGHLRDELDMVRSQ